MQDADNRIVAGVQPLRKELQRLSSVVRAAARRMCVPLSAELSVNAKYNGIFILHAGKATKGNTDDNTFRQYERKLNGMSKTGYGRFRFVHLPALCFNIQLLTFN